MSEDTNHFIQGKRIYLREVRLSDANDNYYRWMNDSKVTQHLETRYIPQSIDNIKTFIQSLMGDKDNLFLAICLIEEDKHIGNIKLGPINWIHGYADVSLFIGERQEWGKGYATEAIKILTDFAFNTLNLRTLKAGCYSTNKGSAGAFMKAGYLKAGIIKGQWLVNGKAVDEMLFSMRSPFTA